MAILSSLLLTLSLCFSGISATYLSGPSCDAKPELMGSYFIGKNHIVLCVDNIEREKVDPVVVLHHELLHAVHENFGIRDSFFSNERLEEMVNENLDVDEIVGVILSYPEEQIDQELEVRVLSNHLSELQMALIVTVSRVVELLRLALWG